LFARIAPGWSVARAKRIRQAVQQRLPIHRIRHRQPGSI
jgi:hypothetical protein